MHLSLYIYIICEEFTQAWLILYCEAKSIQKYTQPWVIYIECISPSKSRTYTQA